jgi:endonuclease/exonuclease/phosphatase family metal-dependent hydrolase
MSRADRSRSFRALLPVAVGCAVALALAGCGGSSAPAKAASPAAGRTYTLLQMNVCLSGLGACYPRVRYPVGVQDVIMRIRDGHPDAITLNEACSGDVARIARRTGYHPRFSTVIYHGKPFHCITPGGRGVFGDAVLTRAAITSSENRPFQTQAGPEHRRWLCAVTRVGVEVCTAHLASPEKVEERANTPQCRELTGVLARRAVHRTVIFAGDVNRLSSCAPHGFWTRTDISGHQDAGSQQAYGTGALRSPVAQVTPAAYTDHDVLVVRARLR